MFYIFVYIQYHLLFFEYNFYLIWIRITDVIDVLLNISFVHLILCQIKRNNPEKYLK